MLYLDILLRMIMNKTGITSTIITIAAIITAAPRLVVAMMRSEGLSIPPSWNETWTIISIFLSIGMAILEGLAFGVVFNAWRREKNKTRSVILIALAIFSALMFVGMVAPSVVASVKNVNIEKVFDQWGILLWAWATCVSLSTISIVMSVGYSEISQNSPNFGMKYKSRFDEPKRKRGRPPKIERG